MLIFAGFDVLLQRQQFVGVVARLTCRRVGSLLDLFLQARWVIGKQIVSCGDKELDGARLALPGGATCQLSVDASGTVGAHSNDVQSAGLERFGVEFDIRAAASHVGGNGDGSRVAGTRNNVGFLFVLNTVE